MQKKHLMRAVLESSGATSPPRVRFLLRGESMSGFLWVDVRRHVRFYVRFYVRLHVRLHVRFHVRFHLGHDVRCTGAGFVS